MRFYLALIVIFYGTFADARFFKEYFKKPNHEQNITKIPIVFHTNYDISLLGLENLHPFDTKKYGKIANHLIKEFNLDKSSFYSPEKITDKDLELVHPKEYLSSLRKSSTIASIAEVPVLKWIPNFLLQRYLLDAARYATAGTVLGAELAIKNGWAINLSGGYHHTKANSGGGFCFFADIPLAIKKLRKNNPELKVLVLDLDAHQGNGHESILALDPLSFIFDIYVDHNYPLDYNARKYINFNYPVESSISDSDYLSLLKAELPKALTQVKPDLIIYNAGSDVYQKDPLGQMNISAQGIIERDLFVFTQAKKHNIPILMVLSGGYSRESASIVSESITNLLKKVYSNSALLSENQKKLSLN